MADLMPILQAGMHHRNFERGHQMFAVANCFRCHRFGSEGTAIGPDLPGGGGDYNVHDLLESVIEPSKVIPDQYRATIFELADGRTVAGRITNFMGDSISVSPNLLEPDNHVSIDRHNIESMPRLADLADAHRPAEHAQARRSARPYGLPLVKRQPAPRSVSMTS